MYQLFVNRFGELGAKVQTTEAEYNAKDCHIRKFRFKIICVCGHLCITPYYDFAYKKFHNCLDCNKIKLLSTKRVSYEKINENFEEIGCYLLTTKEEYENNKSKLNEIKFHIIARCGHERIETLYYEMINSTEQFQNCLECNKEIKYKNLSEKFKDTFEEVKEKFMELGIIEFLTTKKDFEDNNMRIGYDKFRIIPKCGHEYEVRFSDFKDSMFKTCGKCARFLKDNGNLSFDEIYNRFLDVGCELLTTIEEFVENHMTTYSNYKFKATCGHERSCILGNLNLTPNMLCKSCSLTKCIENQIKNAKKDGLSNNNICEYESLCFMKELLEDEFDIEFMDEGCKVDMVIKPKHILDDNWIGIQMKCTNQSKNDEKKSYNFTVENKDYSDMILICTCVKDQKIWIVDPIIAKELDVIQITDIENTKYYKFKISLDDFVDKMKNLYESQIKSKLETLNIAQNISTQKEQEFRKLRELKLNMFKFEAPIRNYLVYDFKLNGLKVQEKVAGIKEPGIIVSLRKGNGNKKKQAYDKGDNDYYWIHNPNKEEFYVIPEEALIINSFISYDDIKGKMSFYLNPLNKNHWTYKYLYSYEKLNIEKLKCCFKL
jgi:hypothetical protein